MSKGVTPPTDAEIEDGWIPVRSCHIPEELSELGQDGTCNCIRQMERILKDQGIPSRVFIPADKSGLVLMLRYVDLPATEGLQTVYDFDLLR